jgi:hypothetical protein
MLIFAAWRNFDITVNIQLLELLVSITTIAISLSTTQILCLLDFPNKENVFDTISYPFSCTFACLTS